MKYELSPSILSADFARLGEEIKAVEQTGVNYLHNNYLYCNGSLPDGIHT